MPVACSAHHPLSYTTTDKYGTMFADRRIPIDWLTLKRALTDEVVSSKQPLLGQFEELMQLLELLTLLQFSEDVRYVQSAMRHVCPELTAAEQQLLSESRSSFSDAVDDQELEQEILDSIVKLLFRARYTPLTQQVCYSPSTWNTCMGDC